MTPPPPTPNLPSFPVDRFFLLGLVQASIRVREFTRRTFDGSTHIKVARLDNTIGFGTGVRSAGMNMGVKFVPKEKGTRRASLTPHGASSYGCTSTRHAHQLGRVLHKDGRDLAREGELHPAASAGRGDQRTRPHPPPAPGCESTSSAARARARAGGRREPAARGERAMLAAAFAMRVANPHSTCGRSQQHRRGLAAAAPVHTLQIKSRL